MGNVFQVPSFRFAILCICAVSMQKTSGSSWDNLTVLDTVWRELPPYSYAADDGVVDGVLPTVLGEMMERCYQDVYSVDYTTQVGNGIDLEIKYNDGNVTMALPVAFPYLQPCKSNSTVFIPVIQSPGAVLVMAIDQSRQVGSDMVNIIFEGWPLLLIILISAGLAGTVMWLLDRLWNPLEFPRPFIRGFWEGFWWAFVTMTTVGYGDRSPRSIPARLFGIAWIIVGIAILSVFTAIVTTEMTEQTFAIEYHLEGMKLGALNGTEDHRLAVQSGAEVTVYNTLSELYTSVDNMSGYLLDQLIAAAEIDEIGKLGHGIAIFVENPVHYGILVTNIEDDKVQCFNNYVMNNRHRIFSELSKRVKPLRPYTLDVLIEEEPLFHTETIMLILYGLAGWAAVIVIGVIWEFTYYRPKHKRRKAAKKEIASTKTSKAVSWIVYMAKP
uniref:Uncharacterized protein LOC102804213 n=1 Tax=Saccoglossus kowalevskii TaxID=10224 RepID=A0ABM0MGQ7_SACKO|nr:PREDICTED: uncharacterized protein LOC102804213 [Saccoglossus kowalevskii]